MMKFSSLFTEGVQELKTFFNSSVDLLRIKGLKKSSNFASKLVFGLLFVFILSICILFWIVTLALFLGEIMNSYALGFLIMGAVPTIILALLYFFRQKIKNRIRDAFIRLIT